MIRTIILLLAAAVIAGCAAPAPQPLAGGAGLRIDGVATLATNECEVLTAADATSIEVMARTVARRVAAGTLDTASAQRAVNAGRAAVDALRAACVNPKAPDAGAIARARQLRADMAAAIGG